MSIKELEKYAKDNNTTNFQALIDLMQKKENALDYLVEIKRSSDERFLYDLQKNKEITQEQRETFLENIANSKPSKSKKDAQYGHYILNYLYDRNFFSSSSDKFIFDNFNKIKPAICSKNQKFYEISNLSNITSSLFRKDPSVISDEKELLSFLNNQMEYNESYSKLMDDKIKQVYFKTRGNVYLTKQVYDLCYFDPDDTIRQIDYLNRIIESDIYQNFIDHNPDYVSLYSLSFIEDISYDDLRDTLNKISIDYLYNPKNTLGEKHTLKHTLFKLKYNIFHKEPKIFDDEETVKNLILDFIEDIKKEKWWNGDSFDLKKISTDPRTINLIDNLQQNLTIDVVEVLKNDPQLSELYEVQKLRNELAHF